MASVRFKFRSSATFDSVDIGEQSSISIRDLKSKIVLKKHLNLCQDSDLVFSDFLSGQEYKDESIRIPSGSSVIIKRVPAKSSLLRDSDTSPGCFGVKDGKCVGDLGVIDPPSVDVGVNNLNDFGIDLCPPPCTNLSDTGELLLNNNGKKDYVATRCSQEVLVKCQKLETALPGQLTPKGSSANEGSTLVVPKPKIEEQTELKRAHHAKYLAMESCDMPSELKCSLCRTFFKEAVMIPCCQHSFCGKCIRAALSENAKCPMCSSTKCKPNDLLPNVSLTQAIERFLESQLLLNGSEDELHRYAPDGESGIQVKEISYAATVPQKRLQMNQPVTGKYAIQKKSTKLHDCAHPAETPGTLEDFSEFEGENEPQNIAKTNEEVRNIALSGKYCLLPVVSCSKIGEGVHAITGGGERNFTDPGRPNKGPRTCFMCGSPDHLIRDCPGAVDHNTNHWNGVGSRSLPGAVSGYPPTYWQGNQPYPGPYINMYGGPGMMFYNTNTAPISPLAFPSCSPSMYGGYPVVSGYMNVGGITPQVGNFGQQPRHVDHLEHQDSAYLQRNYDVDLERERIFDRDRNVNTHHNSMERGLYHSGDEFPKSSEGKHRNRDNSDGDKAYSYRNRQGKTARNAEGVRDLRIAQSDMSSSEKDVPDSRIRPREDRQEKLHKTYRSSDEFGKQHGRESALKHYQPNEESSKRKRVEYNERKSDRHSHSRSRSSLEHSYSGDGARHRREESSHRSRHSNRDEKVNGKEMHSDRGKIKYSDDYGEDCHRYKRKKFR
ncbi:E3 ubiquitin ligase PQT3-like isoform X1 [Chenopodium quinoa]|uniref:E3 ubiquitin ligase PQT3-like isoform X1 n=1 Tax=Chenopodium quinoa TaxID=63459 RepID=UPI000B79962F|nr:E3 ubiquitin ligase PQT3-like isoform X1 [Chenopodium quinoa]